MIRWAAIALLVLPAVATQASDWPGWRGPRHDGSARGPAALDAPHVGLQLVWRRELGSGYSGISVADGIAVTQASDGQADWLVALDAETGADRWRVRLDDRYAGHDGSDDGPSATPVIGDGIVYGLSAQGRLLAVGLQDGALRWQRRLDETLQPTPSAFGFATTPLVVGDLVVVGTGGTAGAFTAFDASDGEIRWRAGTGRVEYQSPVVTELLGETTILALGDDLLLGLDPEGGAERWRLDYGEGPRYSTANVVPLDDRRLIVLAGSDTVLFQAAPAEDADRFREVWRQPTLEARLSTSVHHEGWLYGFDGRFLACVDAATGLQRWKSRPPGGGNGLILVGDHLVILGKGGDLVVARATPDGYDERARLPVLADASVTYPSHADGTIFVRDIEQVAAVRLVARDSPAPTGAAGTLGILGDLQRRLQRSDSPRLVVDAFMRDHPRLPIVEDDGQVHFLWRGRAEDVGIQSSHLGWGEEPLTRLPDTDLWFRSERLPQGVRVEYRLNVDFDNVGPDPANPRRVPAEWGDDYSVLTLPGHVEPAGLGPFAGSRPGETTRETVELLGRPRDVVFWTPPGHRRDGTGRLLVVLEGRSWLDKGMLLDVLRHGTGTVAVFVGPPERGGGEELAGARTEAFVEAIATRLVPEWTERLGLSDRASDRTILGRWGAAHAAIVAGLDHPGRFGNVAAISLLARDELPALLERIDAGTSGETRFHVSWNRYERWDADRMSREVHAALGRSGYVVEGGERDDSAGWGGWRAWAAESLQRSGR